VRRLGRDLFAAVLTAGLVAGTVFGSDDWWPFAQMRQFPRGPRSVVWALAFDADLADGRRVRMGFEPFHLRRAEVEGQVARVVARPRMLGDLMASYNRGASARRRIVRLHLLSRKAALRGGRLQRSRQGTRHSRAAPPPGIRWRVTEIAVWPPA
jgi:hypothetical protein